ncbi:hypothetical protein [Rhodococcoides yunnanense]|uniref:hypothetical protein n=1 Tax=Rhodococcoides yunnanense TaxID=278209 RepID=UPI0009338400|nr:hypothetical protein [Rhodococcus yunnanensis]
MTTQTHTAVHVGDRSASGSLRVGDLLLRSGVDPVVSQTIGTAGLVFAGLSSTPVSGGERTGMEWKRIDAVEPGDSARVYTVVTRVAVLDRGTELDRHVRVVDSLGNIREEGTETWSVPTTTAIRVDAGTDFCTGPWADALVESLARESEFADSLSTWDGTIGLRCTDGSSRSREIHLRIYRGRIIDVTRRTPHGATFVFTASARAWIDLVTAERNDFMRRAIRGEFDSSGDGYEYLRLTKPLGIIVEHARTIAKGTRA